MEHISRSRFVQPLFSCFIVSCTGCWKICTIFQRSEASNDSVNCKEEGNSDVTKIIFQIYRKIHYFLCHLVAINQITAVSHFLRIEQ